MNKKIEKLIQDINKKLISNEGETVTLKGVKNLSVSDLDELLLYAKCYSVGDYYSLMQPMGSVELVLKKYEII